MLWSPVSKTLAVHYICLNPYLFMTTGQLNFAKVMQDNFSTLRKHCNTKSIEPRQKMKTPIKESINSKDIQV